ncbi:unnamed protein product [Schistosoma mattheei]|uniref:Uncharacterized protein n=1 Tax=Schistosoma mattheei TaxID=31246 RepID=A0A183PS01_9TREM|nr:unnamed protein product [Schistosoma mattheei]
MTKEDAGDVIIVANFLTFIGKEAYSLLKTLAMPEKPTSLSYRILKDLMLDYVQYTNFECGKGGRSRKMIHEDINNSTILLHSIESNSSSELNEIHDSCKTTVFNQSIYQIFHVIVPNVAFPNDSHISDKIPRKSEENMLSEHNCDRKPDVFLIDANFSNDPLLSIDILNKFEETISEESNVDCEPRALDELDSDCNSDDFISTAVHPYHKFTSTVYYKQCEKYVLNEATLSINWGYKDPTLFRGGGWC